MLGKISRRASREWGGHASIQAVNGEYRLIIHGLDCGSLGDDVYAAAEELDKYIARNRRQAVADRMRDETK